jgi:hypothetical protein
LFPLTYEVFPGNRLDRTTLEHILDTIEKKFGKARRLWVFDRGGVSDDNLELLRQRGAHYLVGTPKNQLKAYEQKLLAGDWQKISDQVQVQLIPEADEVYVLCRSTGRVQKERAMRRRWLRRQLGDLRRLRRRVKEGQLKQRELIQRADRTPAGTPSAGVALVALGVERNRGGLAVHLGLGPREVPKERAGRRRVSPARPLDRARPGQTVADLWAPPKTLIL